MRVVGDSSGLSIQTRTGRSAGSPDVAGNQAFRFAGTGPFAFEGDIEVTFANGNTFILGNTDTDIQPEFEIQLNGLHTISATDFIL